MKDRHARSMEPIRDEHARLYVVRPAALKGQKLEQPRAEGIPLVLLVTTLSVFAVGIVLLLVELLTY